MSQQKLHHLPDVYRPFYEITPKSIYVKSVCQMLCARVKHIRPLSIILAQRSW